MFKSKLKKLFARRNYILLGLVVGFLMFIVAVWLRNFAFLRLLIASPLFAPATKIDIFFGFLFGIKESLGVFPSVLTITMSILFGVNAALFIYYLRTRPRFPRRKATLTFAGLIAAVFGVGCASCGSFLLFSVLGAFGASSLVAIFPLQGQEFGILSIVLLSLSIYWLARSIRNSQACRL